VGDDGLEATDLLDALTRRGVLQVDRLAARLTAPVRLAALATDPWLLDHLCLAVDRAADLTRACLQHYLRVLAAAPGGRAMDEELARPDPDLPADLLEQRRGEDGEGDAVGLARDALVSGLGQTRAVYVIVVGAALAGTARRPGDESSPTAMQVASRSLLGHALRQLHPLADLCARELSTHLDAETAFPVDVPGAQQRLADIAAEERLDLSDPFHVAALDVWRSFW
jgi:hypothetical protein